MKSWPVGSWQASLLPSRTIFYTEFHHSVLLSCFHPLSDVTIHFFEICICFGFVFSPSYIFLCLRDQGYLLRPMFHLPLPFQNLWSSSSLMFLAKVSTSQPAMFKLVMSNLRFGDLPNVWFSQFQSEFRGWFSGVSPSDWTSGSLRQSYGHCLGQILCQTLGTIGLVDAVFDTLRQKEKLC